MRTNLPIAKNLLDFQASTWYSGFVMGNRLREVLAREGVTAYRLWKDLGIDQGQLSRLFKGKGNLSVEAFERIADYLEYDLVLVKRARPKKGEKKNGDYLQAKKHVLGKVLSKR